MNHLVGDIGNTSIKISILNYKFDIKKSYSVNTNKIYKKKNISKFFGPLLNNNLNKDILFSSVVPKAYKLVKKFLLQNKFKVYELKDLKIKKLLKIKIKNYSQLGSDRISNAIGSLNYKNCIIIDFGTATTFDIIKNGTYVGGVISPGIKISIINLSKSTALLPILNLKKTRKNFGKTTQEALNTGFLWGYEGLINNILKKISFKSKKNFKIILTGGYASLFKRYIKKKTLINQNITINGVAKALKELV